MFSNGVTKYGIAVTCNWHNQTRMMHKWIGAEISNIFAHLGRFPALLFLFWLCRQIAFLWYSLFLIFIVYETVNVGTLNFECPVVWHLSQSVIRYLFWYFQGSWKLPVRLLTWYCLWCTWSPFVAPQQRHLLLSLAKMIFRFSNHLGLFKSELYSVVIFRRFYN